MQYGEHSTTDSQKYQEYVERDSQEGKRNGFGVLIYDDGYVYVGQFKNGSVHGTGVQKYTNGYYFGDFAEGYRSGYGKYVWNSGNCYEGSWQNNARTGFGTYYYADGRKYVGEFVNDEMHGEGVLYYSNGSYVVSEWTNGNMNLNQNTYFYEENGSLVNGKFTVTISEIKYSGNMTDGRFNGTCSVTDDGVTKQVRMKANVIREYLSE